MLRIALVEQQLKKLAQQNKYKVSNASNSKKNDSGNKQFTILLLNKVPISYKQVGASADADASLQVNQDDQISQNFM